MGVVTFGIPIDLATDLVRAGQLTDAVETGTYLGDSAVSLRELVPRVWSVELLGALYQRAVERVGVRDGIALLQGYSPRVLAEIREEVRGPSMFWLDAHGGTAGVPDLPPEFRECPVMDELDEIAKFPYADQACILIDDARAFFGPMLQHNPKEWPTFLEVSDRLRSVADRYVTVLDDVIIAVPNSLRPVVDDWWRKKLMVRHGYEAMQERIQQLADPTPAEALARFARSLLPAPIRDRATRWVLQQGVHVPAPRQHYLGSDALTNAP